MLEVKQVFHLCVSIYTYYFVVQVVTNPSFKTHTVRTVTAGVKNLPRERIVHARVLNVVGDLPPLFIHEDLFILAVAQHQVTRVQQGRNPACHRGVEGYRTMLEVQSVRSILQSRAMLHVLALLHVHRVSPVIEPCSVLGVFHVRAAGTIGARSVVKMQDSGVMKTVAILFIPPAQVIKPGMLFRVESAIERVRAKV